MTTNYDDVYRNISGIWNSDWFLAVEQAKIYENDGRIWMSLSSAFPIFLPLAILVFFWGGKERFGKFLEKFEATRVRSGLCPTFSRRERFTKWAGSVLNFGGNITEFWKDGSLLCSLINNAVPGACSNPYRHWRRPPTHGQALAFKYFGITPIFNEIDFQEKTPSPHQEIILLEYLLNVQQIVSRATAKEQEDKIFTSKYLARGMGLITGERYRKTIFYIYPSGQKGQLTDVLISIKGPYNSYGKATVTWPSTQKLKTRRGSILEECKKLATTYFINSTNNLNSNLNKEDFTEIPIKLIPEPERVKVVFISNHTGVHELCLTSEGAHLRGSPFNIQLMENTSGIIDTFEATNQDKIFKNGKTIIRKFKSRVIDFISEKVAYEDVVNKPQINIFINHVDNYIKNKKNSSNKDMSTIVEDKAESAINNEKEKPKLEAENMEENKNNYEEIRKNEFISNIKNVDKTENLSVKLNVEENKNFDAKIKYEEALTKTENNNNCFGVKKQFCKENIDFDLNANKNLNTNELEFNNKDKDNSNEAISKNLAILEDNLTHTQENLELEFDVESVLNNRCDKRRLSVEHFNLANNDSFMKMSVKDRRKLIEDNCNHEGVKKNLLDAVVPPLISLSVKERRLKIEQKLFDEKNNLANETNPLSSCSEKCPDVVTCHLTPKNKPLNLKLNKQEDENEEKDFSSFDSHCNYQFNKSQSQCESVEEEEENSSLENSHYSTPNFDLSPINTHFPTSPILPLNIEQEVFEGKSAEEKNKQGFLPSQNLRLKENIENGHVACCDNYDNLKIVNEVKISHQNLGIFQEDSMNMNILNLLNYLKEKPKIFNNLDNDDDNNNNNNLTTTLMNNNDIAEESNLNKTSLAFGKSMPNLKHVNVYNKNNYEEKKETLLSKASSLQDVSLQEKHSFGLVFCDRRNFWKNLSSNTINKEINYLNIKNGNSNKRLMKIGSCNKVICDGNVEKQKLNCQFTDKNKNVEKVLFIHSCNVKENVEEEIKKECNVSVKEKIKLYNTSSFFTQSKEAKPVTKLSYKQEENNNTNTDLVKDTRTSFRRKDRFKKAQRFFKQLEKSLTKNNGTIQTIDLDNKTVESKTLQRRHSLEDFNLNKKKKNPRFSKRGGSLRITNISERFSIKNLYKDIIGDHKGIFKGRPNQQATAEALGSNPPPQNSLQLKKRNTRKLDLTIFENTRIEDRKNSRETSQYKMYY